MCIRDRSCTMLIVICAPAAYALSRFDFVCNKLIQTGLVASMGVPVVMIVLPLFAMVAGLNILNNVAANRGTLIFLYIGINVPYTTIFLTTFFANLSRAFEEAAAIDGCPPVKTFWLIMLPMAQPGIVTVTIFNFINIWNEYFISLIFGNSDKVRPVAVGLYSMINSMKYTGDWAGMFSAVVIVFQPTFILYIFPVSYTHLDVHQSRQVILVTKDILLRIKAQIIGIRAEDFMTEQVPGRDGQYTGRAEVYAPEESFKDFKKKGIPVSAVYMADQEDVYKRQCGGKAQMSIWGNNPQSVLSHGNPPFEMRC